MITVSVQKVSQLILIARTGRTLKKAVAQLDPAVRSHIGKQFGICTTDFCLELIAIESLPVY